MSITKSPGSVRKLMKNRQIARVAGRMACPAEHLAGSQVVGIAIGVGDLKKV
jgi:hypothetical protein